MEVLLQGFLYEDTEAYPCDKVYREQIIEKLKEAGCIRRKKVCLAQNEEITKLLVKSAGEIEKHRGNRPFRARRSWRKFAASDLV